MDAYYAKAALEMALEDETFSAAFGKADKLSVSEAEDGTITLEAGDESVEIALDELEEEAAEEREEDKPSTIPPPPAAPLAGAYGAIMKGGVK